MSEKIPRILHQVWWDDNPIPAEFIKYREGWRSLHPDWEYRLWTKADARGTSIEPYCESAISYASKSNILRVYAVLTCGGVYADFDCEWNKNINEFLQYDAFIAKETPTSYCNAFFGAVADHPWLAWQFDQLDKVVKRLPPWGPQLATLAMARAGEGVTTLPTEYVYPYLWGAGRVIPAASFQDAYLAHHWTISWKPAKRAEQAKRKERGESWRVSRYPSGLH